MTHYIVKKMKGVALLATLLIIITQTGCNSNSDIEPVTQDNYFLDTTCSVSVYQIDGGLDEDKANAAITKAYDRCRELDKLLSNKTDSSDVTKVNRSGGAWVTVGKDAATVIKEGLRYGKLSGGAFDITIGRVTDLWDFHADKPKLPDEAKLQEALRHVDYRNVEVDGNRIRLLDPEAKIDLGGIAKGYVGDEMRKVLKKEGVTSAVINLGGNIVTVGTKPDGSKYTIGIEKPFSDRQEIIGCTHIGEGIQGKALSPHPQPEDRISGGYGSGGGKSGHREEFLHGHRRHEHHLPHERYQSGQEIHRQPEGHRSRILRKR